jgi:HlyD family secretion protein
MKRLLLMLAATLVLAGCGRDSPGSYQGYIEGDTIQVATSQGGRLIARHVERGATVQAGAPLFALEQDNEAAAAREAESHLAQSRAQAANLTKGKRAQEIAVIEGQIAQAQAQLRLSQSQLARSQQLRQDEVVSQAQLDDAVSTRDRDAARVRELRAQLATAKLAARQDEIEAGQAQVAAAEAALTQAQWRLGQKAVVAPATGQVLDTLYEIGEWVPPGAPVLTLLPPAQIKARFFVPEPARATLKLGGTVVVHCDGCARDYRATINFISPEAEFTPPVIYSEHARSKLVYLVEARFEPADAMQLHPGQPVDVSPQP